MDVQMDRAAETLDECDGAGLELGVTADGRALARTAALRGEDR